jgi:hypothetical protein
MTKKINPADNHWVGFLDKLGIGAARQTEVRAEQFFPEGFELEGDTVSINLADIPEDLLPMTVNGPSGIVHLLKDRIVVHADNGAIYHLSRDGQVLGQQSHVSSISAKDESEVLYKQETRHSDKVVHEWTFVKGGSLTFEVADDGGIARIRATDLGVTIEPSGAMVFWKSA